MRLKSTGLCLIFLVLCFAAGSLQSAEAAVWKVKTVALPVGGSQGALRAVSCFSTSVCTAVGHYWNGSKWGASGNEWNGTEWPTAAVLPNIGSGEGAKNGNLQGLSCYAANACVAVGAYGFEGSGNTLVELKSKKVWTQMPSPNHSSGKFDELYGVSCNIVEALVHCVATGRYVNTVLPEERTAALAEEFQAGGSWKLLSPVENPGGQKNGHLFGASCVTNETEEEERCITVGGWGQEKFGTGKFIGVPGSEIWNPEKASWTVVESPTAATSNFSDLYNVSCVGPSFCMAVGRWSETIGGGPYRALADVWNGTKWSNVLLSGGPKEATESGLHGVSCLSSTLCEVVGSAKTKAGVEIPLAYRWKSGIWELQEPVNPSGAVKAKFESVSCVTAESCKAVGEYIDTSEHPQPFAENFE